MTNLVISLERHRSGGKRLTYYTIKWTDGSVVWSMRPETYRRLKKAINKFDGFLEKIMPPREEKNEPNIR